MEEGADAVVGSAEGCLVCNTSGPFGPACEVFISGSNVERQVQMKKRRKKRSFITVTHRDPQWLVKGRRAVKSAKRQGMNILAGVGIITVIVLLVQTIMK